MLLLFARTVRHGFSNCVRMRSVVKGLGAVRSEAWHKSAMRGEGGRVHIDKRQRGGIEPLHVSMPRELKSRPSTSPTHSGPKPTAKNSETRDGEVTQSLLGCRSRATT